MQISLSADYTVLVESDYNLEKLWNGKRIGLAKIKQTLTKYFQNNYILITNKHVRTEFFIINANSNPIEKTLIYKCLGVTVHEKWFAKCSAKSYVVLYPNMLV